MQGEEDAEGTAEGTGDGLGDDSRESAVDSHESAVEPLPAEDTVGQSIANARRRHGAAGAIMAASMFGLDQALGRKPREEAPIVISTGDEPIDIDDDGIVVAIDDNTSVVAPPQPRPDPFPARRRRRKG
jgi:hypothetical protein